MMTSRPAITAQMDLLFMILVKDWILFIQVSEDGQLASAGFAAAPV
jgi:hypothetical protein